MMTAIATTICLATFLTFGVIAAICVLAASMLSSQISQQLGE